MTGIKKQESQNFLHSTIFLYQSFLSSYTFLTAYTLRSFNFSLYTISSVPFLKVFYFGQHASNTEVVSAIFGDIKNFYHFDIMQ